MAAVGTAFAFGLLVTDLLAASVAWGPPGELLEGHREGYSHSVKECELQASAESRWITAGAERCNVERATPNGVLRPRSLI